jgi:hypothetical protein
MRSSPEGVPFGLSVYPQDAEQDHKERKCSRPRRATENSHFQAGVAVQQFTGLVFKVGNERTKGPDAGRSPMSSVFNAGPWRGCLRARMQAATAPFQEAVVTGSGSASGA